jgi:hypothetical protein
VIAPKWPHQKNHCISCYTHAAAAAGKLFLCSEGAAQSFPPSESYNLIFLTSAILSIVSIAFALLLFKTKPPKCQNHLLGEEGAMDTEKISKEILLWSGVTANRYRYGGIEYRVNKRDMGHIHGEKLPICLFLLKLVAIS